MIKMVVSSLLFLSLAIQCFGQQIVKPKNPNIVYSGRVIITEDSTLMYWPGTSAKLNFKGTSVSVKMKSLKEPAYYYAIVDGDESNALKFKSDSTKSTLKLADHLSGGKHSIEIYKLSNCTSEDIFYGFEIEGNGKLLKSKELKRTIEFYGNSITAGHGVDVEKGARDSGAPEFYNNYYTYAALTARHFNAKASYIARGGIGVTVSWFPEIMPETYSRIDPLDSTSRWDFTKYTPDVVVINLFQNDSWLVLRNNHDQFKARFGDTAPSEDFIIQSYIDFVKNIRAKYPQAYIICALGNMDATKSGSKWPGYVNKAVELLQDNKVYSLIFPYKNRGGHPNKEEQKAMANQLIQFIESTIPHF